MTNRCQQLEGARERAWREWEEAKAEGGSGLPPVIEPLGHETPEPSGEIRSRSEPGRILDAIDRAREAEAAYVQAETALSKCYHAHEVPEEERAIFPPPG